MKRLGMGDEITDHDAYHTWPALVSRGGSEQQMPWLRPAANFYRPAAKAMMIKVLRTAGKTGG